MQVVMMLNLGFARAMLIVRIAVVDAEIGGD